MSNVEYITIQGAGLRLSAAAPAKPKPSDNLPRRFLETAASVERTKFDASAHLNFEEPSKIYTFADLHKEEDGISSTAVSEPFSLFTAEAISQMRAEIFDENTLDKYYCQTGPNSGQVRGHCPRSAPFITRAWNDPEVLKIISRIAGIELVPAIDYDIGHINISVNNNAPDFKPTAPGEQQGKVSEYCESPFGWHTDSYPFVVVTMLSDCDGMVGGETAIRMGNGEIMKARGPASGTAVVMQGRYLPHQATAALGGRERISMITSFRPKSAFVKDETTLRGVRNISHVPTLYAQFAEYRLENLEERVRAILKQTRERRALAFDFDTVGVRDWLTEQRTLMDTMLSELRVE